MRKYLSMWLPSWPWTHESLASVSQVLTLEVHTSKPGWVSSQTWLITPAFSLELFSKRKISFISLLPLYPPPPSLPYPPSLSLLLLLLPSFPIPPFLLLLFSLSFPPCFLSPLLPSSLSPLCWVHSVLFGFFCNFWIDFCIYSSFCDSHPGDHPSLLPSCSITSHSKLSFPKHYRHFRNSPRAFSRSFCKSSLKAEQWMARWLGSSGEDYL